MKTKTGRLKKACLYWGAAGIGLLLLSCFVGKYTLSWEKLMISGSMDRRVFLRLRLPRGLMAFLAGAVLSLSGSIYQTVFRNPIASPDVIGTASGASAGAAFGILFLGGSTLAVTGSAFAGALIAVAACLLLGRATGKNSAVTLLLCGMVVNALCQAILMYLKLTADAEHQLAAIEFWLMGSISDVTGEKLLRVLPFAAIGTMGIFALGRKILLLTLDDDEASMMGVSVPMVRCAALVCATLVTAGVISSCGLISFIGLIPPHMARLTGKTNSRRVWLLSMLMGGALLTGSDILARSIAEAEVPVSIITSFVGAPVLFALLRGKGRDIQ